MQSYRSSGRPPAPIMLVKLLQSTQHRSSSNSNSNRSNTTNVYPCATGSAGKEDREKWRRHRAEEDDMSAMSRGPPRARGPTRIKRTTPLPGGLANNTINQIPFVLLVILLSILAPSVVAEKSKEYEKWKRKEE
ncbi:hypothetical protein HZH66_013241 [Vespula vulgaris]|uniref:Uncharacterized protein n=1 Tax=Vespula vulgaris TaxID=7454 RepID=A0A834J6T8_VESVU|nr:hypothetical protein HZH66_013241 [Vespula vulgaris]